MSPLRRRIFRQPSRKHRLCTKSGPCWKTRRCEITSLGAKTGNHSSSTILLISLAKFFLASSSIATFPAFCGSATFTTGPRSMTLSATPTHSRIPTARRGTLGSSGIRLSSEGGRTCWQRSSGRRQRRTRRRVRLCHADKSPSLLYRPCNPLGSTTGLIAGQQTAEPKCGRKLWRQKQTQVARDPEATSCTTTPPKKGRAPKTTSPRSRSRRHPSGWQWTRSAIPASKVPLRRLKFPRDKIDLPRKPARLISIRLRDRHATRPQHDYTPSWRKTLIPRIVTLLAMSPYSDNSRRSRTKFGCLAKP